MRNTCQGPGTLVFPVKRVGKSVRRWLLLTSTSLGSSLLLLWLVDLGGSLARVFWMQRLSCGLQRMLLLFGCSGMSSSCRSTAEGDKKYSFSFTCVKERAKVRKQFPLFVCLLDRFNLSATSTLLFWFSLTFVAQLKAFRCGPRIRPG